MIRDTSWEIKIVLLSYLTQIPVSYKKDHFPSAQLECKQIVKFFDGITHVGYINFSVKVQ